MKKKAGNTGNEEKFVRLAKPVRKGLLRLVFSRFLIIFLLLVLQVLSLVALYEWVYQAVPYVKSISAVVTVMIIIYLINSRMDPTSKLTWMWIIALTPVLGGFFLLFSRVNLGYRNLIRQVRQQVVATKDILPKDEAVYRELKDNGSGTDDLVNFANRSGCFPICRSKEAVYFPSGEAYFEALLKELEQAEKFIFLEYFFIDEGYMWGKILEILLNKVKQGVEIRVLYDGMSEVFYLRPGYFKLLEKEGIQAKTFLPIKPILSSHYNYRDHRKILVIDGKCAFTGGINLADEYINRITRFGHWKDTGLMIKGPAVSSFTLMFLQMWNLNVSEAVYEPYLHEEADPAPDHEAGYIMPYADSPVDQEQVGENIYLDMLYRADRYIYIMTPYLILDGEMEAALCFAGERGVDVRIVVPGIPDKIVANSLTKSHYRRLTECGVKIYEYTPGFMHSKTVISDDVKGVVGSINFDYRSLYHHFECAAYLYKCPCIREIKADFEEVFAVSKLVDREQIEHEKVLYRILGQIMKFVAPLF
ncbi:MAG: cardiolipin synthase [Firmicutes bacterium]|nr:cardiolipin synthase [Bacillota bacterium]